MHPYSPQATEDEPTMTDLRGVLPVQRPPVDATVLDEPTSEVPVITPATDRRPDSGANSAAVTEDPATGDPASQDPASADAATDGAASPAATTTELPVEEATAVNLAGAATDDPAIDPDPDPDPDQDPEPDPDPELSSGSDARAERPEVPEFPDFPEFPEPESYPVTLPDRTDPEPTIPAAATAPEVSPMTEPIPAPRTSEMSKMTWTPAPPPPAAPPMPPALSTPLAAPTAGSPVTGLGAAPEPERVTGLGTAPEPPTAGPEPAEPGPRADEPEPKPVQATGGRPGDVSERPIALWSEEAADRFRDQWRDLQIQFIDDPDVAVAGAKDLVTEAVQELADTLLAAQDELDPYRGDGGADTETMRVAMRRYREFLERVLAL